MRIAFFTNVSNIKGGGIFTYSVGILKMLMKDDRIEKIFLVIHSDHKNYFNDYKQNEKISAIEINRSDKLVKLRYSLSFFLFETYFIYKSYFTSSKILSFFKNLSLAFNPYYSKLKNENIDLFYFPFQYAQIYGAKIPTVTTMHDVQELHFPEFFDSKERLHRAINTKKSLEEADSVIVSFSHVRSDIQKFFEVDEQKTTVCLPPLAEEWFSAKEYVDAETLYSKYDFTFPFILYPAATWRHKNHIAIIEALRLLEREGKILTVIFTGNKTKYLKTLENRIEELRLKSVVKFLGIIPEEDLIGLYKSASLVVAPTLYEAGSGILFESMKYGAPAVCSNITSIPETMNNDEYLFDPNDYDRIATLISQGVWNEEFRKKNKAHLGERLNYYKELNYADSFIDVFEKRIKENLK